MRTRSLVLCALLVFLACDDDEPTAPPPGGAPKAAFDLTRTSDTTILVDASASDPGVENSLLWVRWDWEGNGVWDTEWSETRTAAHDYGREGVWTIRLEVGDGWRRLNQTTHPATVVRILTPERLVESLAMAYRNQDWLLLRDLLANDPERNAEYLFLLSAPTEFGETQWGTTEEVRIHQRMFEPWDADPPVAPALWQQSLVITLTPLEAFTERPDFYTTNGGPLDPAIWRAKDARYTTYVFFDLQGTDYKVEGEANFIVLEDLTKMVGDTGKFLLYIWEDIAAPPAKTAADPA